MAAVVVWLCGGGPSAAAAGRAVIPRAAAPRALKLYFPSVPRGETPILVSWQDIEVPTLSATFRLPLPGSEALATVQPRTHVTGFLVTRGGRWWWRPSPLEAGSRGRVVFVFRNQRGAFLTETSPVIAIPQAGLAARLPIVSPDGRVALSGFTARADSDGRWAAAVPSLGAGLLAPGGGGAAIAILPYDVPVGAVLEGFTWRGPRATIQRTVAAAVAAGATGGGPFEISPDGMFWTFLPTTAMRGQTGEFMLHYRTLNGAMLTVQSRRVTLR